LLKPFPHFRPGARTHTRTHPEANLIPCRSNSNRKTRTKLTKTRMNASSLPRRSHALMSSCASSFISAAGMTGYSIHYIKQIAAEFVLWIDHEERYICYVHRCPTHQCTYAYVSSNLRIRGGGT
jgi:hypothetical protein